MTKRAILRFDGSLEQGFQVTLEVGEDQTLSFSDVTGALPPAPELVSCLTNWQQHYRQLSAPTRIALQQITIRTDVTAHLQACHQCAQELQQHLHTWLESPRFKGWRNNCVSRLIELKQYASCYELPICACTDCPGIVGNLSIATRWRKWH